jgi:hypothetical protein
MRYQRSSFLENRCGNCVFFRGLRLIDDCYVGNGLQHCMTSECEKYVREFQNEIQRNPRTTHREHTS